MIKNLDNNSIKNVAGGNICSCKGYRGNIDAQMNKNECAKNCCELMAAKFYYIDNKENLCSAYLDEVFNDQMGKFQELSNQPGLTLDGLRNFINNM